MPSIWEDVRFIDGVPGRYVVIARRGSDASAAAAATNIATAAAGTTTSPRTGIGVRPDRGGRWYIAGINADPKDLDLTLSFADVPMRGAGTLITDADTPGAGVNLAFRSEAIRLSSDKTLSVRVRGRGGFVIVFD